MGIKNQAQERRYIQFPLCLLQRTYENPQEGFNVILDFGIVSLAQKTKYDIKNVGVQLMYAYYRNQDMIQSSLLKKIQKYIDRGELTVDLEYCGFNGNDFDPLFTSIELPNILQNDDEFREEAILRYQIVQAEHILRINDNCIDNTIEHYKTGLFYKYAFEDEFGCDCWPGIKISQIIEIRDSCKDLDLFRAYVGIKSLIGKKKFIITTRNVILMRMLGCKSYNALQDFLNRNKEAKILYDRFTRSDKAFRYNFDKLFNQLLSKGFIKSKLFERKVSRKIFLSTKLDFMELANEIIEYTNKRNYKEQELEARNKIRATIK